MNQPIATNPFMILLLKIILVFVLLFVAGRLIRSLYNGHAKKKVNSTEPDNNESIGSAAVSAVGSIDADLPAVLLAAIMAYGYSAKQIRAIRPLENRAWKKAGRIEGCQNEI